MSVHHAPAALHPIMDPCTHLMGGWEATELVWRSGKPKNQSLLPGLNKRISPYCMHLLFIHRRLQLLKLFSLGDKLMSTGHCLPDADRAKLQYMCHFTAYGSGT